MENVRRKDAECEVPRAAGKGIFCRKRPAFSGAGNTSPGAAPRPAPGAGAVAAKRNVFQKKKTRGGKFLSWPAGRGFRLMRLLSFNAKTQDTEKLRQPVRAAA
jgi:hypothetical protein